MTHPLKPAVLVTGSAMLAWDLIHRSGDANTGSAFDPADRFAVYRQSGGAWHVTNILRRMPATKGWEIHGVDPTSSPAGSPKEARLPHRQLSHAYATWTDFARTGKDEKNKAVRVKGYLGTEIRREDPPQEWFSGLPDESKELLKLVIATEMGNAASPKVDGKDVLDGILSLAKRGRGPWIVWKYEGADSDLTRGLSAGAKKKTDLTESEIRRLYEHAIAIVPVRTLRGGKGRVGHGLSWESLVTEVLEAIEDHDELPRFRWIIVSFPCVGALVVSQPDAKAPRKSILVYDPAEMEGTWTSRYPGEMVGSATCLVAAVATALVEKSNATPVEPAPVELDSAALEEAARDGLLRMRALHYLGYFTNDDARKVQPAPVGVTDDEENPTTRYAAEPLASLSKDRPDLDDEIKPKKGFARVELPAGGKTILEQPPLEAGAIARSVATEGPKKALADVPRAVFADLITTDPREIQALQAIATLIQGYVHDPGNKPLSIAVFGQPGSGKSFGVKQIARQFKDKLEERTFNLSQLEHPGMLVGALHQVRDIGLKGKIPLVFWDEFDTTLAGDDLGWLRYFLAPMQDGEFQEDQVTHPIGRAVFVFAGGTCEQMKDFHPGKKAKHDHEAAKRAKVPDFVSRLRGYLDVPGLNPRGAVKKRGGAVGAHLQVRRGTVLYSLLKKVPGIVADDDQIRIAPEVVNAFLEIPEYLHGARSMEAIVRMSALQRARSFTASCLPSEDQLALHVDGNAFLRLASAL